MFCFNLKWKISFVIKKLKMHYSNKKFKQEQLCTLTGSCLEILGYWKFKVARLKFHKTYQPVFFFSVPLTKLKCLHERMRNRILLAVKFFKKFFTHDHEETLSSPIACSMQSKKKSLK